MTTPAAIARSVAIYWGDARRRAALDRWYRRFVRPHGLAFDVGAHVGDRTACFRRLGARVVAIEPQPALARFLRRRFRADPAVTLVPQAVGARPGRVVLHVNDANPTVSTASAAFLRAAADAPGWEGQRWTRRLAVPATTLAALIERHGAPDFIKIDVEGLEEDVLAGLPRPVAALSVEFTTIQRDVALAALARLAALGYRAFNASLGESLRFALPAPQDARSMRAWIEALPVEANSGDIYASLTPRALAG